MKYILVTDKKTPFREIIIFFLDIFKPKICLNLKSFRRMVVFQKLNCLNVNSLSTIL